MAEQGYDLMHKDDIVASLQLDDLSGAILKVTPSASPELLPLGGSQGGTVCANGGCAVPSLSVRATLPRFCSRRASPQRRVCSCGTSVSVSLTTTGSSRTAAN